MTTKMTKTMMVILTTMATATPAMAGDFGLLLNINRNSGHAPGVSLGISIGRHLPAVPVKRIWVAPVYETVIERVWIPTVQTAYRDVPVTNLFGRVISYRREPYTIESGYWTEIQKQVLVRRGYWTTRPIRPRLRSTLATTAVARRPDGCRMDESECRRKPRSRLLEGPHDRLGSKFLISRCYNQ